MKTILILIWLFGTSTSWAQTTEEFLKQKETQKKYLLEQLAALKLYASLLKEGYSAVNKGVKSIAKFTNGELNLHTAFFNSLREVNPMIARSWKVAEILNLQSAINKGFRLGDFTISSGELSYFNNVRVKIFKECSNDIDELLLLISSDNLEMKDDERIGRIENLHTSMTDKYEFTKSFVSQVKQLSLQRKQQERNLEASKKISQIKD